MNEFILMLVILNPFAQVLYLMDLMDHFHPRVFIVIHLKATLISFMIFFLFSVIGENYILKYVFQVRLSSLQIFGGIIMLFIAFRYIMEGSGSNILFTGDISELVPKISLPYMVGPGTLWISMLIGRTYPLHISFSMISGVLLINFIFIIFYQAIQYKLNTKKNIAIVKYFAILMRANALFIGAVAIEMLITGIRNVIIDFKFT